jgi:hypothetical protein
MIALTVPVPAPQEAPVRHVWSPAGHQFLPVSGFIPYRFLVTYRAPAASLIPLVPRGFSLDTHRGFGFLSVCVVEIEGMGISGTPRFLRFENREFLYRLALRLGDEPTFATLRSDVSSRALAFLGRRFSHYRPRLAQVSARLDAELIRLECVSADGRADAVLSVDTAAPETARKSVFKSADEASAFLLGMKFSADARSDGRIQVQPIEHGDWNARFAQVTAMRFEYISRLGRSLGTQLTYDHTLFMQDIEQRWEASKWL